MLSGKSRKWLKRLGYTLLILFVLLNIMAALHAYKFTRFYDTEHPVEKFEVEEAGFFDKAKALIAGVKSYKKKIDSLPPFNFNTVILKTSDGLSLEAWESADPCYDTISPFGTIIMFHGHGGNKAGVLKEAAALHRLNYHVLLVDFRAHGNSEGNICTIGANEASDVKAAYDYISTEGEKNIILWGISMGAAAQMKAVNDYNLKPSKMILEMPFGTLLEAVKARCRIMGVPAQPISSLLTFWGGVQRGFNAFDLAPESYAKKISCPVLLQWGENDLRVTRKETESIFQNLGSPDKALITYTESGHQSLLVNEKEKWLATVSAFLKKK